MLVRCGTLNQLRKLHRHRPSTLRASAAVRWSRRASASRGRPRSRTRGCCGGSIAEPVISTARELTEAVEVWPSSCDDALHEVIRRS